MLVQQKKFAVFNIYNTFCLLYMITIHLHTIQQIDSAGEYAEPDRKEPVMKLVLFEYWKPAPLIKLI